MALHARVAEVDHIAIVIGEVTGTPDLLKILGNAGAAHVSGLNEPPYPHLQVTDSANGDDGLLLWNTTAEVNLLLWGELHGEPGSAELRRMLMEVMAHLVWIPDRPHVPGRPVVVKARPVGKARWQSDRASEQPCWAHTVEISAHPDNSAA